MCIAISWLCVTISRFVLRAVVWYLLFVLCFWILPEGACRLMIKPLRSMYPLLLDSFGGCLQVDDQAAVEVYASCVSRFFPRVHVAQWPSCLGYVYATLAAHLETWWLHIVSQPSYSCCNSIIAPCCSSFSCPLGPALSCGRAWQNKQCLRKVGCLVRKKKVSLKRNWTLAKVHVMLVDDIWSSAQPSQPPLLCLLEYDICTLVCHTLTSLPDMLGHKLELTQELP